ncbi:MAG: phosphatidylinositol-specific phospholipase C/glycerophosphodiester phosphodiesterase family protein [Verrucomicrobiota bacterium]|nr:phosphatidylinositol-specific phospholipase C/glycerophosphodiester phosphodiesterase family protein [Verrucomicrobiota bacterium]
MNFLALSTSFGEPAGHSHNDYRQEIPLWTALTNDFKSIEADVFLRKDKLLVAHDAIELCERKELTTLYLEPLKQYFSTRKFNGNSLILLIDVKSEALSSYRQIEETLKPYESILTKFAGEKVLTNHVTVLISGNRAINKMERQRNRLAALDGRLSNLEEGSSAILYPLISQSWGSCFKWNGEGAMPEHEKKRLRQLVQKAHQNRQMIRFWGSPDVPECWKELKAAGADLINTDRVLELARFLKK